MAYNNPYSNFGTNPYGTNIYQGGVVPNYPQNPYQFYAPQQTPVMQPQMQQQPQQPQTNYLPLSFINGVEGAKTFVVLPKQTFYLRDSDSNLLFIKKADEQGKCSLTAFELNEVDINNLNKRAEVPTIDTKDFLKKEDLQSYVTTKDFKKFELKMETSFEKIYGRLEKLTSLEDRESD